jgi:hypothetical protein
MWECKSVNLVVLTLYWYIARYLRKIEISLHGYKQGKVHEIRFIQAF